MEKPEKHPPSDREAKLAEALRANLRRRKRRITPPPKAPDADEQT
jgi:hypothetical protein